MASDLLPESLEPIDYSDGKVRFATERCRGKRVLDIGCVMHLPGAYNSRYFLHRAIHETAAYTVGLDLHAEGVENMRRRGHDVRLGNAEGFDLGEQFDVIVAGDIIEHIANVGGFIESCDRHLAPGGKLVVMTPNPWFWRFVVQAAIRPEVNSNPEHTCWFDPRTWRQLAARYGFEVKTVEHYTRYRRDKLMPLPKGLKYSAWAAETVRATPRPLRSASA